MAFYGRRIVKILDVGQVETYFVISGQWAGHKYGNDRGTDRQREILLINVAKRIGQDPHFLFIEKISEKLFWKICGTSGDEYVGDTSKISFVQA